MTASCKYPSSESKTSAFIAVCSVPQKISNQQIEKQQATCSHRPQQSAQVSAPSINPCFKPSRVSSQATGWVQIQQTHGDPATVCLSPGFRSLNFSQACHRRLIGKALPQLNSPQFTMTEKEFEAMAPFKGVTQNPLAFWAVQEVILRRPAWEHVRVIQDV